jgi:hypothetical protein
LLNPKLALKTLCDLLRKDGCIYLVLPNAMKPPKNNGIGKGFRTSFIRPVHISYFHPENVLRIANYSGLSPAKLDTSGETIMLLKHSIGKQQNYTNHYAKQRKIFLSTAKESFFFDYIRILKDIPKVLIKRFLNIN